MSAGSTFFRQRPTDLEPHAENIVLVVGTKNKRMRSKQRFSIDYGDTFGDLNFGL
jgi:hypothetical protein